MLNSSNEPGSSSAVKDNQENSLGVQGPRLFTTLPRDVREAGFRDDGNPSVVIFKTKLNILLADVPDEPGLGHQSLAKPSISITHQINRRRAS